MMCDRDAGGSPTRPALTEALDDAYDRSDDELGRTRWCGSNT